MHVVIHPEADQELEAAARWYDGRQPGLGEDFLNEFERTFRRMIAQPDCGSILANQNRKLNFERFPDAIVYGQRGDNLFIKAVMHLHRRPFYWQDRFDCD